MNQQVYVKKGKKYAKVGPFDGWEGFPTDGIWLVEMKHGGASQSCILKLGDVPELYPFANMMIAKDKLASFIYEQYLRKPINMSANQMAVEILKFLSQVKIDE